MNVFARYLKPKKLFATAMFRSCMHMLVFGSSLVFILGGCIVLYLVISQEVTSSTARTFLLVLDKWG